MGMAEAKQNAPSFSGSGKELLLKQYVAKS